jgi:hypothetical protein
MPRTATTFVAIVAFISVAACSSKTPQNPTTASFYRTQACVDWGRAISGAQALTMTPLQVAAELSLMAGQAQSVGLVDASQAAWSSAINRLRVDILDSDKARIKLDEVAAKGPC